MYSMKNELPETTRTKVAALSVAIASTWIA